MRTRGEYVHPSQYMDEDAYPRRPGAYRAQGLIGRVRERLVVRKKPDRSREVD